MRASKASEGLSRPWWAALFLVLVGVRGVWLAVDWTPMLFLGDSSSYFTTALSGWIPPDRSFAYGYVVRAAGVWPGSLRSLIALQATCSVAAGLLLAGAIRTVVGAHPMLVGGLAVAWMALEPLGLLWERYVMAEACALPLFGAFVLCGLRYLATTRMTWLLLANLAGLGVLAFRLPFAGVAWLGAIVLPALALVARPGAPRRPAARLVGHLLVSVAAVGALHAGYRGVYSSLSGSPAAYQHADGFALLAAWAPLLEPEDFPDPALGAEIVARSKCALRDPAARNDQLWRDGCLVSRLRREVGDPVAANQTARVTSLAVLRRSPLGISRLAADTWLGLASPSSLAEVMRWDRQELDYPAAVNQLLAEQFGVDGRPLPHLSTATNRWYFRSVPWLVILACSPALAWLAFLLRAARAERRLRESAWVAIVVTAVMAVAVAVAIAPVPRYLHPLGWLAPVWIAELIVTSGALLGRWRETAIDGTPGLHET